MTLNNLKNKIYQIEELNIEQNRNTVIIWRWNWGKTF